MSERHYAAHCMRALRLCALSLSACRAVSHLAVSRYLPLDVLRMMLLDVRPTAGLANVHRGTRDERRMRPALRALAFAHHSLRHVIIESYK
jgi:hypothetical protein